MGSRRLIHSDRSCTRHVRRSSHCCRLFIGLDGELVSPSPPVVAGMSLAHRLRSDSRGGHGNNEPPLPLLPLSGILRAPGFVGVFEDSNDDVEGVEAGDDVRRSSSTTLRSVTFAVIGTERPTPSSVGCCCCCCSVDEPLPIAARPDCICRDAEDCIIDVEEAE